MTTRKTTALLTAVLFTAALTRADLVDLSKGGGGGGGSGATNPELQNTVQDNLFTVRDNVDNTKLFQFQASGIATGTTRTYTMPDLDTGIPGLAVVNTWTTTNSFAGTVSHNTAGTNGITMGFASPTTTGFRFATRTPLTPDGVAIELGSTANSWRIYEGGDGGSDMGNGSCGTTACAHPQVIVSSANANTTENMSLAYWGSASRSIKTLTESAATNTVQISVAAEAGTGGTYYYTIYATDGSTPQVRQGRVIFSVTADGATETCVLGTPEETDNTPTGTLTVAVTCDTSPANAVNLQLNAVSSLTQTTLEAYSRVELVGPGQVTPQ